MAACRQLWRHIHLVKWRDGGRLVTRKAQSCYLLRTSATLSKKVGQFTGMKAADGCDLRKVEELLEDYSCFRPGPLPSHGVENVLRLLAVNDEEEVVGESFIFNFGCFVSWDGAGDREEELLDLVRRSGTGKIVDRKLSVQESDNLQYEIGGNLSKWALVKETLKISSEVKEDELILMKLASSHALARSVNLAVLEDQASLVLTKVEKAMPENTLSSVKTIPKNGQSSMASPLVLAVRRTLLRVFFAVPIVGGSLKLRTWDRICLEIFRLKFVLVNPDMNDSLADFYWEHSDVSVIHSRMLSVFSYHKRVKEVTKKLNFCLNCLTEYCDSKLEQRDLFIEAGIVVLVLFEVLAGNGLFYKVYTQLWM